MTDRTIAALKAIDPARRMPPEEPAIREVTREMIVQSSSAHTATSRQPKTGLRLTWHGPGRLVAWASLAVFAAAVAVGVTAAVHRPPIASAATVKARTLRAVSAQQQAVLYTLQTQPDGGNPAVTLTFESWRDNADGRRNRERDYRDGVLFFEQATRPVPGQPNTTQTLEYAAQQNVYCLTRSVAPADLAKELAKKLAQKQAAWQAAHPGQPLPSAAPATGMPSAVAMLLAPLQAADITRVGKTILGGRQVLELADSEPGMHRRYYVDPKTYLPVRMVERPDGLGLVTIDYTWLPASSQASCWFTPPAGATEVSVSQFPIRD
jgi:hypothetical protein